LTAHVGDVGDCSYRSGCHTLGCLEDAKCAPAPGAWIGPCSDVPMDLTPMSSASCDWRNTNAPAQCWAGCPVGYALTGLFRDANDNLRGITKVRCCQASALAPTLLSVVSAAAGSEATLLYPGQRLCSPTSCSYYLTLQTDGRLALYNNQSSTLMWTSSASSSDANPCTLAVQPNGSVAIYNRNNVSVWSGSPVSGAGSGPYTLRVSGDGWPFVYDAAGTALGDPSHLRSVRQAFACAVMQHSGCAPHSPCASAPRFASSPY
jgi:hypothetical protein